MEVIGVSSLGSRVGGAGLSGGLWRLRGVSGADIKMHRETHIKSLTGNMRMDIEGFTFTCCTVQSKPYNPTGYIYIYWCTTNQVYKSVY